MKIYTLAYVFLLLIPATIVAMELPELSKDIDHLQRTIKHFGITDQNQIDFLTAIAQGDSESITHYYLTSSDFTEDYLGDENFLIAAITLLRESQKQYSDQSFQNLFRTFKFFIESTRRKVHIDTKIKSYNLNEDQITFLNTIGDGDIGWNSLQIYFLSDDDFMDTLDMNVIRLAREIAQIYKKNFSFNNYHDLMHKLQLQQGILESKGKIAPAV